MTTIYERKVPAGQEFVFADGTKVRSIQELGEKISIVEDTEFHRYVNEEKNDFVNWLVYSLQNEELANIIAEIRSRPLMYLKIRQYILKNKGTTTKPVTIERPKKTTPLFSAPQKEIIPEREKPQQAPQQTIVKEEKQEVKPNLLQKFKHRKEPTPKPTQQTVQEPQLVINEQGKEELSTEFVVKEFIYGVVCGILIGLIIAKIIEILF